MTSIEGGRLFVVRRRDWSVNPNAPQDEARHNEKVREAIKDNLQDLINDGSIITADPQTKRIVKIPMRSLELPRFRFGDNSGGFGTGDGEEGDIIGKRSGRPGDGEGEGAGDQPGVEHYEAEVTLDELREMVYEDLGLPYLEPKEAKQIIQEEIKFNSSRRRPSLQNIDLLRTIMENIQRNATQSGKARFGGVSEDDLWVRTWEEEEEKISSAVVIAMADISGSMGSFERYVTRAFCWWMVDALRYLYPKVEIVFIVHDAAAEEVGEEEFFTRGSSGGTVCSTANELAKQVIDQRYPPSQHNLYILHFSDGDNSSSDNDRCIEVVEGLLEMGINQYGYVQIGEGLGFIKQLLQLYQKEIAHERFHGLMITSRQDIYPALKEMFSAEKA